MADGSAPKPLVLASRTEEIARYTAVAETLKFEPGGLIRERIIEFCREHGIPVYPNDEVTTYLNRLSSGQGFEWVPLCERDQVGEISVYWRGHRFQTDYTVSALVPEKNLRNAAKIQAEFADVRLFVSEVAKAPDPFICAWGKTMREPIIFGVWNEPGFGLPT